METGEFGGDGLTTVNFVVPLRDGGLDRDCPVPLLVKLGGGRESGALRYWPDEGDDCVSPAISALLRVADSCVLDLEDVFSKRKVVEWFKSSGERTGGPLNGSAEEGLGIE